MGFARASITAAIAIWLATLYFAQSFTDSYARTYRHHFRGFDAALPPLTRTIGLPVIGHGDDCSSQSESWQFYAARALLVLPPLLSFALMWLVKNRERLIALVVFALPVYVASVAFLVVMVVGSLWLPYQIC